jgi:nickel-type superoxide dismutase maturation protease
VRLAEFWPLATFVVADTSMQPALRPGDRLVVLRWARPRRGDIVVLRDPEARSTFLAKRVADRNARGHYVVAGDNPNVSRDSREFGPLPRGLIVGRVVWQYRPRSR